MSITEARRLLGISVPRLTLYAGVYLEAQGFRFLVDFGVVNAVAKATDEFLKRAY